jgi:hypothetical protein
VKSLYYVLIPLIWVSATAIAWLWDGPLVFVPGIEGRWVFGPSLTGLPTVTNTFAELSVPTTTAVMRAVCAGVAVASAAGVVLNRFLGELRLPSLLVTGVYAATVVVVGAALFALRSRPEPERYAASLPLRATISTKRPASAPPSETVAPGLTLNFDCIDLGCGVRAGQGCAAYPNYPSSEKLMLRRDDRRGWWVFDMGEAQLVFRDRHFECLAPRYVHVMSDVRPATGAYVLAFSLIAIATLPWRASRVAQVRHARSLGFLVFLCCAWALYPMLPALLTVWF